MRKCHHLLVSHEMFLECCAQKIPELKDFIVHQRPYWNSKGYPESVMRLIMYVEKVIRLLRWSKHLFVWSYVIS
jgi:hypothetical protein